MAGRRALIIGSQCAALGPLSFTETLAVRLSEVLLDPQVGAWTSALEGSAVLLDPTVASLKASIKTAFLKASASESALLISFIGHAVAGADDDYYLLAKDSPPYPDSDSAFHIVQQVRELLDKAVGLDGVIWLIDACESAEGVRGAGRRWLPALARSGGRMELLVASGDAPAYGGCFTHTLIKAATVGVSKAGEYLLGANLRPLLAANCPRQTPQLLSFDGSITLPDTTDTGLWLVANVKRRGSLLSGDPAAGFVDQITRGAVITPQFAEKMIQLQEADGSRLRAVVGAPGAGKSTLACLLLRPEYLEDIVVPQAIDAAVFLDRTSTAEAMAQDLARQLCAIPSFLSAYSIITPEVDPDSYTEVLDVVETQLCIPLENCNAPGVRVRVLIDGLDQPDDNVRAGIFQAIARLCDPRRDRLDHLRVIITARTALSISEFPGLGHAHQIKLNLPSKDDLTDLIQKRAADLDQKLSFSDDFWDGLPEDGGWLVARLLTEVDARYIT
jgi:hypothetical protein